jgi:hypothetical protein
MCLREESDVRFAAPQEQVDNEVLGINENRRSRSGVEANIY